MMSKRGISFVAMLITVIALLILISAVVFQAANATDQAKTEAFAKDLDKIEEQVKQYYLTNNSFPVYDDMKTKMSEEQVLASVDSSSVSTFIWELSANGDYTDDKTLGEYYTIDLSKIDIKGSSYGLRKNSSDIYVVAYPSFNVYYLSGVKTSNDIYFSLSKKLIDKSKIQVSIYLDNLNLNSPNINMSKKYNTWTNIMPLELKANLASNQELYIKLSNIAGERKINSTVVGSNDFNFNLSDLMLSNKDINGKSLVDTAFTADDINAFESTSNNQKNITVLIKTSGVVTETTTLPLANYDGTIPYIQSNTITHNTNDVLVNLKVSDNTSGVKQVRYDYIDKLNPDGSISSYYNNQIDNNYVRQNGKIAILQSDGTYNILLDKNIDKIYICVQDYAGNWHDYNNYLINQ